MDQLKAALEAAAPKIESGDALLPMVDSEAPKDAMPAGSGDFNALFTRVRFVPVSGDLYARERERRNKLTVITGYSRKVAEVQMELAGTGAYTPGTISIVQGIGDKTAHLEMSIGVWNPDTKKSSIQCADAATKDRLALWKEATCAEFAKFCSDRNIDLSAPASREHANTIAVNLLPPPTGPTQKS